MSITLISLLVVIGLILIIVELLITPGIVVGSVGVLFLGYAVYKTYADFGSTAGGWVLATTIVLTIVSVVMAMRSNVWQKMSLQTVLEGKSNETDMTLFKVGDTGKTLSALRPSGNALINNEVIEVSTIGDSIESHKEIIIKEIIHNKIIVKLK